LHIYLKKEAEEQNLSQTKDFFKFQKIDSNSTKSEEEPDDDCRLLELGTLTSNIRIAAEILMEIGAILYIFAALREAKFLGIHMFIENLVSLIFLYTFPAGMMFTILCPRLGAELIGRISWLPRAPLGPIFMTDLPER